MKVSYELANPRAGGESYLLRVEREHERRNPCLLVDAGDDVRIDELLGEDDYLAAILLTHAHLDHYRSLGDVHRDGAPILTSPGTGAVLEDVLREGARHHSVSNPSAVLERVEPVDGWRDVVGDAIRVRPVPAGHAPGACGFLIRIRDGREQFRALATGDFTLRDAGGYAGFDPTSFPGIDALFLTAATADDVGETATEILRTLASRAHAGSQTLCTASGLTGVHLATLLDALDRELGLRVPVFLVGQVAKLYDALGYECQNVDSIPEFANPAECLERGAVTIAGPEVPIEGSSGRLYDAIRTDGNATLVQVQSGSTEAKDAGQFAGTVSSFALSNHPTEDGLDRVVEAIAPAHVIVTHQWGRSLRRYKDKWDAYTWATGSSGAELLYRDGQCVPPDWVGDAVTRRVRSRETTLSAVEVGDGVLEAATYVTELERREVADLEREGVDVDRLREELHIRPRTNEPTTTAPATGRSEPAAELGEATTSDPRCIADGGLYRTVGVQWDEEAATWPNPTEIAESLPEPSVIDVLPDPATLRGAANAPTANETSPDSATGDDEDEPTESTTETETAMTAKQATDGDVSNRGDESEDASEFEFKSAPGDGADEDGLAGTEGSISIDPAVKALVERSANERAESVETFVASAVGAYLADALRGRQPWTDAEGIVTRKLTVDADPALERLVAAEVENAGAADVDAFVARVLSEAIGLDEDARELPSGCLDGWTDLVGAVTENPDCPHETRDEVVQAALERRVL